MVYWACILKKCPHPFTAVRQLLSGYVGSNYVPTHILIPSSKFGEYCYILPGK